MESIGKLSNFIFLWTKTLYQNNFMPGILRPFLTFFEGHRCNKLYEITLNKGS